MYSVRVIPSHVFLHSFRIDVSKGERFYGTGGPYSAFARRDASRLLGTGILNPAPQPDTDNVDELTLDQIGVVQSYIDLYRKKYDFVGVLQGRFFDANGRPTKKYREYMDRVVEFQEQEKLKETEKAAEL
jgi:hypothetical protein